MMKQTCIICLALLMAACGAKHGGVIKQEEMKLIIWDMLRADEVALLESVKDTTRYNLLGHAVTRYEQVFAIHHIDKEQFYSSYKYYEEHPDEHKALMDSLTAYGNRIKERIDKKRQNAADSLQRAEHIKDSLAAKKDTTALAKDSIRRADSLKALPKKDTLSVNRTLKPSEVNRIAPSKIDTSNKFRQIIGPGKRLPLRKDSLMRSRQLKLRLNKP